MTNTPIYKYKYIIYIQVYDSTMTKQTAMYKINTNSYVTAINVASALYRRYIGLKDDDFTVEIIMGIERVQTDEI